jgi:hypothetical protein
MWYSFLLYGRLAYDPTIPNSRFEAIVGERFPTVPASKLFEGWASVSKILPLLTRFYWGALDFQWYPEACWSLDGFESVENSIKPRWKPMSAGADGDRPLLMSVKDFVDGKKPDGELTPEQVADQLQQFAERGLASIAGMDAGSDKELRQTLGDIKAMAALGNYYAEKIRGAVALYRYQRGGNVADHARARKHLIGGLGLLEAIRRAMVLAIRQTSAHSHGINRHGHRGHPSPGGRGHSASADQRPNEVDPESETSKPSAPTMKRIVFYSPRWPCSRAA